MVKRKNILKATIGLLMVSPLMALTISCSSEQTYSPCDQFADSKLDNNWNDVEIFDKFKAADNRINDVNNYLIKDTRTSSSKRAVIQVSDDVTFDQTLDQHDLFNDIIVPSNQTTYDTLKATDVNLYSFVLMQNFLMTNTKTYDNKGESNDERLSLKQYQGQVYTAKEVHEINKLNISLLRKSVEHLYNQGYDVYLVGKGYGGQLITNYIKRYSDSFASGYIKGSAIGGAKFEMQADWKEKFKNVMDISPVSIKTVVNNKDVITWKNTSKIEKAFETVGVLQKLKFWYSLESSPTGTLTNELKLADYVTLDNYLTDRKTIWLGGKIFTEYPLVKFGIKDDVMAIINDSNATPEKKAAAALLRKYFETDNFLTEEINRIRLYYSLYEMTSVEMWRDINVGDKNTNFLVFAPEDSKSLGFTESEINQGRNAKIGMIKMIDADSDLKVTYGSNSLNGLGYALKRAIKSAEDRVNADPSYMLEVDSLKITTLPTYELKEW